MEGTVEGAGNGFAFEYVGSVFGIWFVIFWDDDGGFDFGNNIRDFGFL